MKYSVVYSSKTGNTKMLGEAIIKALENKELIYSGMPSIEAMDSDYIYVGFWTDKGSVDSETMNFLKLLKNKTIFLFGTAGFGESEDYFNKIIERAKTLIDPSNRVDGYYMCQGKMPISVKERYLALKEGKSSIPNLDLLIENFDKALAHPNDEDIKKLLEKIR